MGSLRSPSIPPVVEACQIPDQGIEDERLIATEGAGNIVDSPKVGPVDGKSSASEDVIPEPAMRNAAGYENFHTGVGLARTQDSVKLG